MAQLKVGLIGCGQIAQGAHIPALKRLTGLARAMAADPEIAVYDRLLEIEHVTRLGVEPRRVLRLQLVLGRRLDVVDQPPEAGLDCVLIGACSAVCPPERKTIPGIADGTVRRSARSVASATSSVPAWRGHSFPGSTMFGFSSVPSSTTRCALSSE